MPEDALNRIPARNRVKVPRRDQSITAPAQAGNEAVKESGFLSIEIPSSLDTKTQRNLELKKSTVEEIKTKQTTMRLEHSKSDRLQELCRQYNVSREVLIEALLEEFDKNQQIQTTVVEEAKARHEKRMQVANRKRAQTMIEKFGSI